MFGLMPLCVSKPLRLCQLDLVANEKNTPARRATLACGVSYAHFLRRKPGNFLASEVENVVRFSVSVVIVVTHIPVHFPEVAGKREV